MKIGILGGSFDPAHKGHLAISKEAKKRFKLEKIIWAVTKKNPLKAESKTPISKKIKDCKKIIGLNSFINEFEPIIRLHSLILFKTVVSLSALKGFFFVIAQIIF